MHLSVLKPLLRTKGTFIEIIVAISEDGTAIIWIKANRIFYKMQIFKNNNNNSSMAWLLNRMRIILRVQGMTIWHPPPPPPFATSKGSSSCRPSPPPPSNSTPRTSTCTRTSTMTRRRRIDLFGRYLAMVQMTSSYHWNIRTRIASETEKKITIINTAKKQIDNSETKIEITKLM